MAELVPGHMYLGSGFNGFGPYSEQGTDGMLPLFRNSVAGFQSWTNPANKITYTLPANVGANSVESRDVKTAVFTSRSDMSSFFKAEAGAKASYMSFAGSLSASYNNIADQLSEYYYGMAYAFTEGYELKILEPTPDRLSPEVLEDPDYTTLPKEYTPANREMFFRLFEKYGTHFVSSIQMGGRMFYQCWDRKDSTKDTTTFGANLELEFGAVFSANGSTDWKKVGKYWTRNRKVQIQATGGDEALLNGLTTPEEGQSYASQYTAWATSVGKRPGPIGFSLMSIDMLFSGPQYDAVKQASQDYLSGNIHAQRAPGESTIQINGKDAAPSSSAEHGVSYAVVNRSSLAVLAGATLPDSPAGGIYEKVTAALSTFSGNSDVLVAFMVWGATHSTGDPIGYPTAKLYDFLVGLGAGAGLALWTKPTGSSNPVGSGPLQFQVSYAIVGIPGGQEGSAYEDFNLNHTASVIPEVDLEAFLRPAAEAGKIVYTPS